MREIKFRVWDTYNNRMIFDPYRFRQNMDGPSEDARFNAPYQYVEDWQDDDDGIWRPCIVMQFTGLLDRNGKEIYKDDIILWGWGQDRKKGVIEWSKTHFCWEITLNPKVLSPDGLKDFWSDRIEIVGNRFENPALLKP